MAKSRRRFIPNFDSLESRVVPAGNVSLTFNGATLSISGDNEANGISLTNNGDGTFSIAATDDTTINGGVDPLTFPATPPGNGVLSPFKVKINMKGGDDTVDIVGGDVTVRGDSSIKLGQGNDTLTVDGVFARKGARIEGEAGDDIITMTNGLFDEDAQIKGGVGSDSITIDNVAFNEDARIDAGNGDDIVVINNGRFGEDGRVLGGSGVDDITVTTSRFGKEGRIDAGTGDDVVTIDDTVAFGEFRLNAGNGADIVTITNSRFDFDSRFDMGPGDDEILLGANTFNKEASFNGGSGFDTFTHDGTNVWAAKHKVKSFELFQLGEVTPPGGDEVLATEDTATVGPSGTVIIDVLANDTATDPNVLDPASVTIISPPANGTATVDPLTGAITYINTSGVEGTDSFTYTVADDQGNFSNEATVTITIANQAPRAVNDTFDVVIGSLNVLLNLVANDTDPEGQLNPGSVLIVDQPTAGTLVNNADGTVSYSIAAGSLATTDTFTYTIQDQQGLTSNIGTVTINLLPGGA